MLRSCSQDVVADTCWSCETCECWKCEQSIESFAGRYVKIEVDTAKVIEDEVTQCVSALNLMWVRYIRFEVRGVVLSNEVESRVVGPELVSQ